MTINFDNLVPVTKEQVPAASEMLARAFQSEPLWLYFFPDEEERAKKIPHVFAFLLRYGLLYGQVYATSPNLEGAAIWLPSEKVEMTVGRQIRSGAIASTFRLGIKNVVKQLAANEYMAAMHKRLASFPHLYVLTIGVDPPFQGQGYASALMRPMLARLDRENLPCVLETHREKNIEIYQHYGFQVVEYVTLPGTEVDHWFMLREPAA